MKGVNDFYIKQYCFTSLLVNEISMHHENIVKKQRLLLMADGISMRTVFWIESKVFSSGAIGLTKSRKPLEKITDTC